MHTMIRQCKNGLYILLRTDLEKKIQWINVIHMENGKAFIHLTVLHKNYNCKFCINSTQTRQIPDGAEYVHTNDPVYSKPYEEHGENVYEPVPM